MTYITIYGSIQALFRLLNTKYITERQWTMIKKIAKICVSLSISAILIAGSTVSARAEGFPAGLNLDFAGTEALLQSYTNVNPATYFANMNFVNYAAVTTPSVNTMGFTPATNINVSSWIATAPIDTMSYLQLSLLDAQMSGDPVAIAQANHKIAFAIKNPTLIELTRN